MSRKLCLLFPNPTNFGLLKKFRILNHSKNLTLIVTKIWFRINFFMISDEFLDNMAISKRIQCRKT